jgi:hypothetical protein
MSLLFFLNSKMLLKNILICPSFLYILTMGGEYIKLKSFLSSNGISHYTTPPHTPELNAYAERRHRHIVETAKALLNHANLPPQLWSFAYITATYLINRLPTPTLSMQSPYQTLHHQTHNIHHLHSFGCLCLPI